MTKADFLAAEEPTTFFERADMLKCEVGSERFFNAPDISWLREAWIVGRFGQLVNAEFVCLNPTDPPDVALWKSGIRFDFEVTEALKPNRRRGKEFKDDAPSERVISDDDNWLKPMDLSAWVHSAVERKTLKFKEKNVFFNLLIHLSNPSQFIRCKELLEPFRSLSDNYNTISGRRLCILMGETVFGPPDIVPGGFKKIVISASILD